MANILRTIIENDKGELRKLEKMANKVIAYSDQMAALSDEELKAKTDEFKQRYQNGESLDDLLYEAFAVVREGAKRVLGLYPYPVQIMGGIVLHHGDVPEMRTGEGKTLTATMPVYLNALAGEGVHVVTVNEYLLNLQLRRERPMLVTSPTQRTQKLALTTFVITWWFVLKTWFSVHLTMP